MDLSRRVCGRECAGGRKKEAIAFSDYLLSMYIACCLGGSAERTLNIVQPWANAQALSLRGQIYGCGS